MIRRVLIAYYVEGVKYSRQIFPYIGPVLVVAAVVLTLVVHPLADDGVSDFDFVAYSVPASLNLVGFLMILVYGAVLVAAEVDSGAIRTLLVRPLLRRDLLAAKLLNAFTYALVLSGLAVLAAWLLAAIFGDLTGIYFGDELMYTNNEMYGALAAALFINLAPQLAGAAYAVMVSTLVRRPATAVGLAIGGWLILDYIKYPLGIAPFVFSTYLESSWIVFDDRCNALTTSFWPGALYALIASFAWVFVCSTIAWFALHRRNIGP